jgi:molybdenum cofactor cytidylyltransferase
MKALRVERGAVVSFVGGGGKTTSMFRLAAELCAAGLRVITTTTTHISKDQVHLAPASIAVDDLDSLKARLDQHGHCLVIGAPDGKGRVFGASSELIASLSARPDTDAVLVEADGSRSRPFKAPGEHEPVVPGMTTILVPIIGLNSIGQPLDEDHVHRSEIVSALALAPLGSPITTETIARVLSHPQGGAKHLPAGARLAPLLNKADTDAAVQQAGELAAKLLAYSAVDTVLINSMQQEHPVLEAWAPVAGVILAAGQAARFGFTKQLLPWQDTTLAAHAAQVALDAGLDPVIIVLGHEAEKVEKTLSGLPVRLAFNSAFAAGQSTSLIKGLDALPSRTGAALFLLADQPFVTPAMIRTIVEAHRRTFAPACAPVFEGRRGNPVLFDKALFRELRELRGDEGGRSLLEKYAGALVQVPAPRAILLDIDTSEDYERMKQEARSRDPE